MVITDFRAFLLSLKNTAHTSTTPLIQMPRNYLPLVYFHTFVYSESFICNNGLFWFSCSIFNVICINIPFYDKVFQYRYWTHGLFLFFWVSWLTWHSGMYVYVLNSLEAASIDYMTTICVNILNNQTSSQRIFIILYSYQQHNVRISLYPYQYVTIYIFELQFYCLCFQLKRKL